MEKEQPVIKITNLVKEYKMFNNKIDRLVEAVVPGVNKHGIFRAMDNLNLEIYKGEILGVLGKNGAGKSTLLKMITGVVTPTSGTIEINGKVSSLLELGAAFNWELTGIENIYQHGTVMGLTEKQIEERKQEIIDFADIGDHLYQPVKSYSSGMFARLAFACAINVDPDILIVDEVLSVGDMAFQLKCFKKFEEFKKKGKTIIFVTHNIADVLKNCNRAIILEKGKKTFDGSVKEGVNRYKKIIVGLSDSEIKQDEKIQEQATVSNVSDAESWKDKITQNPNLIEYGNGQADVIDYGIFDSNGELVSAIDNGEEVTFKSKIKFHEQVKDPIFTMTLKDFNGNDIAGTNTEVEKIMTGTFEKGDTAIVEFHQKLPVQSGKYTLSFSCTKVNLAGELEVLSRKYDALLLEVITTKPTVGIVRIDSKITIKKIN